MRKHDDHVATLLTGTKRAAMSPGLGVWPKRDNTGDSCTYEGSASDVQGGVHRSQWAQHGNDPVEIWKLMNETQEAHHPWIVQPRRVAPGWAPRNQRSDGRAAVKSRRKA